MKKIYDKDLVSTYVKKYEIEKYFDGKYTFYLIEYEQNETIIHPLEETKNIQFIVQGSISIYSINALGKQIFVSQTEGLCVLGDIEFVNHKKPIFFAQANSKVLAIALDMQPSLHEDICFLHFVLNLLVKKMNWNSSNEILHQTVEDKVLNYMKYSCKNYTLTNVSMVCKNIHCSRRQLQRVLKRLCDEEKIEKRNKGEYVLK